MVLILGNNWLSVVPVIKNGQLKINTKLAIFKPMAGKFC
jgi:hypothetical protein